MSLFTVKKTRRKRIFLLDKFRTYKKDRTTLLFIAFKKPE